PRYAGYSTYTPKELIANGDRRRSWRALVIQGYWREAVIGQWLPNLNPLTRTAVQERHDCPVNVTKCSVEHSRTLWHCHLQITITQVIEFVSPGQSSTTTATISTCVSSPAFSSTSPMSERRRSARWRPSGRSSPAGPRWAVFSVRRIPFKPSTTAT